MAEAGRRPGARLARTHGHRMLWLAAGHVSLGLGMVGVLLPVMPTTVFLIVAAACYARGSQRFHHWLLHHRWFGPPVRDWEEHHAMTVRSKVIAIVTMVGGIAASTFLFVHALWLRILLGVIALGVTLLILLIRTRR